MVTGRRKTDDETYIDLTPMLDVVFILLIFFIVTTTFIDETAIEVHRPPNAEQPPPLENRTIIFEVGSTGNIWLEGRNIDIRSVRANIERLRADNPDTKVIISAHPKSKSKVYIEIADQAREAGVYDIALATPSSK